MKTFKQFTYAGVALIVLVAFAALFWPTVATVVHVLLVTAVTVAVLAPAGPLVARIFVMVGARRVAARAVAAEQEAADYANFAAQTQTAPLRESA